MHYCIWRNETDCAEWIINLAETSTETQCHPCARAHVTAFLLTQYGIPTRVTSQIKNCSRPRAARGDTTKLDSHPIVPEYTNHKIQPLKPDAPSLRHRSIAYTTAAFSPSTDSPTIAHALKKIVNHLEPPIDPRVSPPSEA